MGKAFEYDDVVATFEMKHNSVVPCEVDGLPRLRIGAEEEGLSMPNAPHGRGVGDSLGRRCGNPVVACGRELGYDLGPLNQPSLRRRLPAAPGREGPASW